MIHPDVACSCFYKYFNLLFFDNICQKRRSLETGSVLLFFFFRHSGPGSESGTGSSRNPEEKALDPGSVIPAEAGTGMTEKRRHWYVFE